jgi:hypothetical protein
MDRFLNECSDLQDIFYDSFDLKRPEDATEENYQDSGARYITYKIDFAARYFIDIRLYE